MTKCNCTHGEENHAVRNGQRTFCLQRGCKCIHYRLPRTTIEQPKPVCVGEFADFRAIDEDEDTLGVTLGVTLKGNEAIVLHPWLFEEPSDVELVHRIMLHEQLHVVMLSDPKTADEQHGPLYAAACNRVGALLGYPPVISGADDYRDDCSEWPFHAVKGAERVSVTEAIERTMCLRAGF